MSDWIRVEGKQCKIGNGYYHTLRYSGESSRGCYVLTVDTTKNAASAHTICTWSGRQHDNCPLWDILNHTYSPTSSPTKAPTTFHSMLDDIEDHKWMIHIVTLSVPGFICILAIIDAYYCRKNDYFNIGALFKGILGILHICTDILFAILITNKYFNDPILWNLVCAVVAWVTNT